jgi:hypothetical protein
MKDGKIAVVENEAERVRLIYRRYLELGGVNALVRDLRDKDIRTKIRLRATGFPVAFRPSPSCPQASQRGRTSALPRRAAQATLFALPFARQTDAGD